MSAADKEREDFYKALDNTGHGAEENEKIRHEERVRLYEILDNTEEEAKIARISAKLNYLCLRSIADEIDWLRADLKHAIHCKAKAEE